MLGSKNWFSFLLFLVKGKVTLEVNGVKAQGYTKFMYDTIRYIDVCVDMGYKFSAIEVNLYTQLDLMDCKVGLLGTVNYFLLLLFNLGLGTLG